MKVENFIERWESVIEVECSNRRLFLEELCDVLGVSRPDSVSTLDQAYGFDRPVEDRPNECIDLYKRGCFMLFVVPAALGRRAVKRSSRSNDRDYAVLAARSRAEALGRAMPSEERRPPFLLIANVGESIDVYADFSLLGIAYTAYPGPNFNRVLVRDLGRPEIVERLRSIWMDPGSLDPSEIAAVELG